MVVDVASLLKDECDKANAIDMVPAINMYHFVYGGHRLHFPHGAVFYGIYKGRHESENIFKMQRVRIHE